MSRIVVALGGNALGKTCAEQLDLAKNAAKSIVDLVEQGHDIVVVHGNGPQVGMINMAMDISSKYDENISEMPFAECGAMSQGYIGFHLQNSISSEFTKRKIEKHVSTIVTQVVVEKNDPAFLDPTKPIGPFYSKEEANSLTQEKGWVLKEDSGRGWRRVVASPKPIDIVEKQIIKTLVDAKNLVIAAGGGGIPVYVKDGSYTSIDAVIDKDFASAKLGEILDANCFIILTAVDRVCINFGKQNQKDVDEMTVAEAEKYINEGHFAPGSMLPKVRAAISFVSSGENRNAIIASLEKASLAIKGLSGTKIIK